MTPEEQALLQRLQQALAWHHRYLKVGDKCSTCEVVKDG